MRVLLLGINYAPEIISTGLCNAKLAEGLVERAHEVAVVTANPYYPEWRTWPGYRGPKWVADTLNGVRVVRCPIYVPAHPTGMRRIAHYITFALSSFVPTLRLALTQKPDYVLLVAPSIVASPVAWLAAKIAGARTWLHVQDFEVGAALATGLLGQGGLGARLALRFERLMVSLFDRASSISPEMCRRLETLGVPSEHVHELRNWADISHVAPMDAPSSLRAEWGIGAEHVALYSGNIGNKQGIEVVVDAAGLLRHRRDILFIVCGDGSFRSTLEARATGLTNIRFKPLQPVERLNDLLNLATVHLLPQKSDAADMVLPSKLTNMLASGRPVIATAHPGTGLAREVEGCGIIVPPENAALLARSIEQLIDDPRQLAAFGKAARLKAEQVWDKEAILTSLCDKLHTWLGNGRESRMSPSEIRDLSANS